MAPHAPDHLQDAVCDDEHFARHFALAADQVARREDVSLHFEHQVVQELGLALLENGHLENTRHSGNSLHRLIFTLNSVDIQQEVFTLPNFTADISSLLSVDKVVKSKPNAGLYGPYSSV